MVTTIIRMAVGVGHVPQGALVRISNSMDKEHLPTPLIDTVKKKNGRKVIVVV